MVSLYEDAVFQEKMEQETPYEGLVCDECGQKIQIDDQYWNINGWILCEDCMDKCRRIY